MELRSVAEAGWQLAQSVLLGQEQRSSMLGAALRCLPDLSATGAPPRQESPSLRILAPLALHHSTRPQHAAHQAPPPASPLTRCPHSTPSQQPPWYTLERDSPRCALIQASATVVQSPWAASGWQDPRGRQSVACVPDMGGGPHNLRR